MNRKMLRTMLLCAAAVLFVAVGISYAATGDAFTGRWQSNMSKSRMTADSPKSATIVYSKDGDNIKLAADETDANGQSFHIEWTGKFDGKYYPFTGDPDIAMVSCRIINSHTLLIRGMKDGKVVATSRSVVSADGKSR